MSFLRHDHAIRTPPTTSTLTSNHRTDCHPTRPRHVTNGQTTPYHTIPSHPMFDANPISISHICICSILALMLAFNSDICATRYSIFDIDHRSCPRWSCWMRSSVVVHTLDDTWTCPCTYTCERLPERTDESFEVRHDRPGLLSMGSRGPGTNSSQVSCSY